MSVLERFTAPWGFRNWARRKLRWRRRKPSTRPAPTNLPGKGLAEHPMLYLGEGYNKMFLVNGGKVIGRTRPGRGTSTTTCGC